jgi:hypothetical protein
MLVDDCTLAAKGLIDGDVAGAAAAGQPALAVLDRLAPDVLAVHLEEVERAEHRSGAGGMMANKTRSGGVDCSALRRLRSSRRE